MHDRTNADGFGHMTITTNSAAQILNPGGCMYKSSHAGEWLNDFKGLVTVLRRDSPRLIFHQLIPEASVWAMVF
jgi:hypothetical protein